MFDAKREFPGWFPDWSGERCVIIASGPSAKEVAVEKARGQAKVIVVNSSLRLAPWADILYGCDFPWWEQNKGAVEFTGLKISQDERCKKYADVRRVRCERGHDFLLMDKPGSLGWGGNSGFHAINLAAQFGVGSIALVGFDMRTDHGTHWHGNHPKGLNNPTAKNAERWRKAIDAMAPDLAVLGIRAVNCSQISALKAYPVSTIEEFLGCS